MENYIAELKAKSVEVSIMGDKHSVFFSHKLLAQSEKYGITIDSNALFRGHIDVCRALDEAIKIVYLGILKYREVAEILKMKLPAEIPTLEQVQIWAELDREQSTRAISYVFEQLTLSVKSVIEQKKKTKRELERERKALLKPNPIRQDAYEIERFLSGTCGLDFWGVLLITYREYLIKLEAEREKHEFTRLQTRDLCFYIIAPHRPKNSQFNRSSDLWPITQDEIEQAIENAAPIKKTRKQKMLQDAFFKQLDGITDNGTTGETMGKTRA